MRTMTHLVDLHTHSTASDGQYTPTELVTRAKNRGIEILALTDHDTTDGIAEAVQAGESLGLRVLPGVELSAKEYRNFHILGYQFDPSNHSAYTPLTTLCNTLRAGREDRKYRIIDFLHEKGVDIPLSEVEALSGDGSIGRPHFAQVMVRHGYVATTREAFDRYLDTDEYQRIERFKADARACVEAIRASGGKASLAHPYQLHLSDDALDALVGKLKSWGLNAMECFYPRHTKEQTAFYCSLAKKYNLHITGGSDFHGERVKPDIALAAWELDVDWLL
jgi:hypothetical protein